MPLAIDHVILAASDLEGVAERLARLHGLTSTPGGGHAALGTRNRIIPLGGPYLELLAGTPLPDGFAGWMVRTDDIDRDAARLGLDVVAMSRTRPDGVHLRWRLAGRGLGVDPELPVFIQWDIDEDQHPGIDGTHRLVSVELGVGAGRLAAWVGHATLPVEVVEGPPGIRSVTLRPAGGGPAVVLGADFPGTAGSER